MSYLVANNLALMVNWTGRGNKTAFKNYPNIVHLIIGKKFSSYPFPSWHTDISNVYKLYATKLIYVFFIVSVRQNPNCTNATITEVENVIKTWLRNAPDREGGRLRRQK